MDIRCELYGKHMELVRAVNEARTQADHDRAQERLDGFRDCARIVLEDYMGIMLMDADNHYLQAECERPMCGGVWLDWEPQR